MLYGKNVLGEGLDNTPTDSSTAIGQAPPAPLPVFPVYLGDVGALIPPKFGDHPSTRNFWLDLRQKNLAIGQHLQLSSELFVRQLRDVTKVSKGQSVGSVERHQN